MPPILIGATKAMTKKNTYFIFMLTFLFGCVTLLFYFESLAKEESESTADELFSIIETHFLELDSRLATVDRLYPVCSAESIKALEAMTFNSSLTEEISVIKNHHFICGDRLVAADNILMNTEHRNQLLPESQYVMYRAVSQRRQIEGIFFMIRHGETWYRMLLESRYLDFWFRGLGQHRTIFSMVTNKDGALLSRSHPLNNEKIYYQTTITSPRFPYAVTTGYTREMLAHLALSVLPFSLFIVTICSLLFTSLLNHYFTWRDSLLAEIKRGIEQEEFCAYYQPIVDAASGIWMGAELLLRWRHPVRNIVSPLEFIHAAEQSGQINDITLQLIERAAAQKMEVMALGKPFYLSINVTASMIANENFVNAVSCLIKQYPVLSHGIVMEFSERDNFSNTDIPSLLSGMQQLRDLGIRWALDDFGTGYAGLSTLQALSFDILKIDRSFVAASVTDSVTQSILGNMAEMGHRLDCSLVAEGVENSAQAQQVLDLDIDYCQGFYYAKPMPYSRFVAKFKIYSA
ncbi:diguanylate cyclase [Photobacterium aphoticum]|uniref:Diguanylate cyclase n=1 Tax=Photobacterium aphoticum TaxID=754436 RepID=A0A090QVE4_9GAMM|nr:diguanylate cyclase [Photobacterium aphoticum]